MDFVTVKVFLLQCFHDYKTWWWNLYEEAPMHLVVETGLLAFIIWLMFIRKTIDPTKSKTKELSDEEVQWLVDTWKPEPLAPVLDERTRRNCSSMKIVEEVNDNVMLVRGVQHPVLNLCSYDFIGSSQFDEAKEAAKEALFKYGCGSCGPRGFYGTIDVHLDLEAAVAKFLGTEVSVQFRHDIVFRIQFYDHIYAYFRRQYTILTVLLLCLQPSQPFLSEVISS